MDYYDLPSYKTVMKNDPQKHQSYAPHLDKKLWAGDLFSTRSTELTPLFIQRYSGIITSKEQTRHNFWEIICVRSGSGHILTGSAREPFSAHTVALVPPPVPHIEYAVRDVDLIWMGLQGSLLPEHGPESIVKIASKDLADTIEKLWIFSHQQTSAIGSELDGMSRRILGEFQRLRSHAVPASGGIIDNAIEYIHHHAAAPLSVSQIAAHFGCSEGYFYRLFKRHTGQTPIAVLTAIRMGRAEQLLRETSLSIAEIAAQVGYDDSFYFSRAFKKKTGVRPSSFRTEEYYSRREE